MQHLLGLGKKINLMLVVIIVIISVVVISGLTWASSKVPDSSVGVVDLTHIQSEHPDFLKLKETLQDKQSEFSLFQGWINKQFEITKKEINNKAEREKSGKSPEEQLKIDQKYQEELQKKANEFNSQITQKQTEIQEYLNNSEQEAVDNLKKTIAEVAADKKLTIVLDKKAIFFGGMDITTDIIEKAKGEKKETTENEGK